MEGLASYRERSHINHLNGGMEAEVWGSGHGMLVGIIWP